MTENLVEQTDAADSNDEFYAEVERATNSFNEREFAEAINICEQALEKWPDKAETYLILGVIAYELGNEGRAINLIKKAHEIDPNCRDYAEALATLHTKTGNLAEGLYFAKLTLALEPHPRFKPLVPGPLADYFGALENVQPSVHYLTAARLFNQRMYAQAIDACRAELEINREHADCTRLLGRALHMTGNYERAVASLHGAIHLAPGNALSHVYLGNSLYGLGRFSEASACHEKALEMAPNNAEVHAASMVGLAYQADEIWSRYRKRAAKWARRNVKPREPASGDNADPVSERKIRIGYLSHALFESPELMFVEPLFKYHDRNRFEIFCYQHFLTKDTVSTHLESHVDGWRNIFDIDPVTASYMLKGDGLDILVDLSGHAEGERLAILGAKAAPVQVAWLGHPEAAASPGIDYVLSDSITAASDRKMCLKDQTVVELGHGLVAVEPFAFYPDPSEPPVVANKFVTFGGICDLARLTPEVVATWSGVLTAVPDSRLLLGYEDNLPPAVRNQAFELFAHYGVTNRIHFLDESELKAGDGNRSNIDFFALIDVMLDTFPVSGSSETCEALWMGVPVITLSGKRRSALMGASILHAANRADWVAASRRQFVKKAAALAKNKAGLKKIRGGLRDELKTAPLFDAPAFVKSVENAYSSILKI